MSFKIRGRIEGLEPLVEVLKTVEAKLSKSLLRKAVGEAGKLILRRAKQLAKASKETGLLGKSLGRKVKVYRNTGVAVAIVGPRKGFRQDATRKRGKWSPVTAMANPEKYAHLVELGTRRTAARPFLKPAIDSQQSALRDAMFTVVAQGLEGK